MNPIRSVAPQKRLGYRNRTTLHTRFEGGLWQFGLLKKLGPRDQEFIPIPECPVHSAHVKRVLHGLSLILPDPQVFALAYVVISGKFLTFVVKSKRGEIPATLRDLDWQGLGLSGVFVDFHPSVGRRIFSSESSGGFVKVWGVDRVLHEGAWCGPRTFDQLIPELYFESLNQAEAFLSPQKTDLVLDLYCGVGRSLKLWEARGARSIGVELGSEAVDCAKKNTNPKMTQIYQGKCSDRIPQLERWIVETREALEQRLLVYLNPPRTGLEPSVLSWLADKAKPVRIAYLSCSPGTLVRDLAALQQCEYEVKGLQPYDFFPQTEHVETLALLEQTPAKNSH